MRRCEFWRILSPVESDPIQVRNGEIAELLRRLDEGRITPTECVMGIEDAIRTARLKATRAGYPDQQLRTPARRKTAAVGTKRSVRKGPKAP